MPRAVFRERKIVTPGIKFLRDPLAFGIICARYYMRLRTCCMQRMHRNMQLVFYWRRVSPSSESLARVSSAKCHAWNPGVSKYLHAGHGGRQNLAAISSPHSQMPPLRFRTRAPSIMRGGTSNDFFPDAPSFSRKRNFLLPCPRGVTTFPRAGRWIARFVCGFSRISRRFLPVDSCARHADEIKGKKGKKEKEREKENVYV